MKEFFYGEWLLLVVTLEVVDHWCGGPESIKHGPYTRTLKGIAIIQTGNGGERFHRNISRVKPIIWLLYRHIVTQNLPPRLPKYYINYQVINCSSILNHSPIVVLILCGFQFNPYLSHKLLINSTSTYTMIFSSVQFLLA